MANDIALSRQNSTPALPSGLSTEAVEFALNSRVDQRRLKVALEDLVRPHFYESPEDRIRDVAVLLKDLAEFSDDVSGWAVREWRLRHDRRPTSAALRQLCAVRRCHLIDERDRRLPKVSRANADLAEKKNPFESITDDERERRARIIASAAESCGFVLNQHGQWQLPEPPGTKPERPPHWSETAGPSDPRWSALRKARADNPLMKGVIA